MNGDVFAVGLDVESRSSAWQTNCFHHVLLFLGIVGHSECSNKKHTLTCERQGKVLGYVSEQEKYNLCPWGIYHLANLHNWASSLPQELMAGALKPRFGKRRLLFGLGILGYSSS